MARLGIITDELTEDFEQALALCKELGIRDLELRSIWNTSIVEHDDDSLSRISTLITDGGFRVCGIASPFMKCHLHEGEKATTGRTHSASTTSRDDQWDVLQRSLDVAERFDAPIVRAFSFWRLDDPASAREEILDVLQDATNRVKPSGRTLGLENEHACNIATGTEAAWYFDRIQDPTLGLIWDPGNIAALGVDPTEAEYRAIADRVAHVHVKDAAAIGSDQFVTPGEGACNWTDQFRWLSEDGYAGVVSLETHFDLDGGRLGASSATATAVRDLAAAGGLTIA